VVCLGYTTLLRRTRAVTPAADVPPQAAAATSADPARAGITVPTTTGPTTGSLTSEEMPR
jgi:hypothetical protein